MPDYDPHLIDTIAAATHEANRVLQKAQLETSGIPVAWSWDELDADEHLGKMDGVVNCLNGFTPEQGHISWLRRKLDEGWRYGPVKDQSLKTHPCVIPYGDLPAEQRIKDLLFYAIVNALAPPEAPIWQHVANVHANSETYHLQHPIRCRPNLADCDVDHALGKFGAGGGLYRMKSGRYYVTLFKNGKPRFVVA